MVMVLVQADGRDSPQEGPVDRLRNTEDPFRNGSSALSTLKMQVGQTVKSDN
jgi:hypothetical protein